MGEGEIVRGGKKRRGKNGEKGVLRAGWRGGLREKGMVRGREKGEG